MACDDDRNGSNITGDETEEVRVRILNMDKIDAFTPQQSEKPRSRLQIMKPAHAQIEAVDSGVVRFFGQQTVATTGKRA